MQHGIHTIAQQAGNGQAERSGSRQAQESEAQHVPVTPHKRQ
jgi:hypothetical protein